MRATQTDRLRLEQEASHLTGQLKALGATKVILFGSLARGQISLFSDIDLLALFDDDRPSRELTRWVYQRIDSSEAVDILAYDRQRFEVLQDRPFLREILRGSKVLYESTTGS